MFDFKLPPLILGTSHAPVPIVQGGMGVGISMQNLAAAVASEGGVGVISAAGIGMLRHPAEPAHQKAIRESLAEEIVRLFRDVQGLGRRRYRRHFFGGRASA